MAQQRKKVVCAVSRKKRVIITYCLIGEETFDMKILILVVIRLIAPHPAINKHMINCIHVIESVIYTKFQPMIQALPWIISSAFNFSSSNLPSPVLLVNIKLAPSDTKYKILFCEYSSINP